MDSFLNFLRSFSNSKLTIIFFSLRMTVTPKIRPRKGGGDNKKRRQRFHDEQRRELRKQHRLHPAWSQQDLICWWFDTYKSVITQPTVSDILSPKYAFLDDLVFHANTVSHYRRRQAYYPELEEALFELHQQLQLARVPITGVLLTSLATRLWNNLEQHKGKPCPSWSNGWMDGFKKRWGIRKIRQYGEAASAQVEDSTEALEEVRMEVKKYPDDDVYNMDETGLFWKATPDLTLATTSLKGKKIQKERLSLALTCNATGTRKLDLWMVHKYLNPRCFGKNRVNINGKPIQWRANKKAWMTGVIMIDYLFWFDAQMSRLSLLILDNFSAHETAIKTINEGIEERGNLKWTKVIFLPPNVTSQFQPLDQGIIRNFKAFYRRRWL